MMQGDITLTLCHAWAVTRRDGVVMGFTDHDRPLRFAGLVFQPETGFSAHAVSSATGLAVDNTEALGALSAESIAEADIAAGLYDGAKLRMWRVDWRDPVGDHLLRFAGTLGEIRRQDGAFHAEIRSLAEGLNQPQGRRFQKACAAVLGDRSCGVALGDPAYTGEGEVVAISPEGDPVCAGFGAYPAGWFAHGSLFVLSAEAAQAQLIRADLPGDMTTGDQALRRIGLWEKRDLPIGTRIRLVAGCDRSAATCQVKFGNIVNFQGFPHLPGEAWLQAGVQGMIDA